MSAYHAKSINSLSFELKKEDILIGKLSYKSWFKFNAKIDLENNSHYQVEPKGFWGTTIELKDNETVLLTFKMNWSGHIVVQTYFNAIQKDYIFKHRGFFKESFILMDQDGTELLIMKPQMKWTKMHVEYQITTAEVFETFSKKELLLMTSIHCANYYMSMMMAD